MRSPVIRVVLFSSAVLAILAVPGKSTSQRGPFFTPRHVLAGIGVSRQEMSDELLGLRTDLMIGSQTFTIMREPQAVPGAARITSSRLQSIFRDAERRSGTPASLLEAISYLESWGVPDAESPAGPRGIMQIAEATARRMGLRIVRTTRYKTTKERVRVRGKKGKSAYRTVRHRTPYSVTLRDERLLPEKAIPAAGVYLAQLRQRFGGIDWAIFAYHCGEGCAADMLALTRSAKDVEGKAVTVPRMFFSNNPAYNRELYEAVARQMERDYSPTYYFRVMRAKQLLALFRTDPEAFRALAGEYKSQFSTGVRAPNRLSVWLTKQDLLYRTSGDIKAALDGTLVKAFDDPAFFGYTLRNGGKRLLAGFDPNHRDYSPEASPASVGTLAYIAFETRRLYDELGSGRAPFEPIEVTSLVEPMEPLHSPDLARTEPVTHCTGQVFDIACAHLPRSERECLHFILDDLGWYGYLGFVDEDPGGDELHIGPAPSARPYFTQVYQDALAE